MRRARNGPALAALIESTTGIPIRIISGDEEAWFDYLAVRQTLDIPDALIVDTGGGSCELILMRGRRCEQKTSLPLGSVVLSEKFTDKGDLSAAAIFRLFNYIHARLSQVSWLPGASGLPVVAVGGNHRAAGRIWKNTQDDDRPLHGYAITRENMNSLYIDLLDADTSRRQVLLARTRIRGHYRRRPGAAGPDHPAAGNPHHCFCETGLRDGVLYAHLNPHLEDPT
jgi:exopolyphosphatase/guanosine-5'-triphosphate,3'-diphosphate pyrophosphatase